MPSDNRRRGSTLGGLAASGDRTSARRRWRCLPARRSARHLAPTPAASAATVPRPTAASPRESTCAPVGPASVRPTPPSSGTRDSRSACPACIRDGFSCARSRRVDDSHPAAAGCIDSNSARARRTRIPPSFPARDACIHHPTPATAIRFVSHHHPGRRGASRSRTHRAWRTHLRERGRTQTRAVHRRPTTACVALSASRSDTQ